MAEPSFATAADELLRIHLVFRPACSVWPPTADFLKLQSSLQGEMRDFPSFWQYQFPNQHLIPKQSGQICFQQQNIATWQGHEKICNGITWLVESYRKSVVFLAIFFWAEAQIIFLTGMWPGFNSSLFWHMEWCSTFPSSMKNCLASAAQDTRIARSKLRQEGLARSATVCLACTLDVQNVELESSEWAPCFACDTCCRLVHFLVNSSINNPTWAGHVRTWNVFLHYVIVCHTSSAQGKWRVLYKIEDCMFVCGLHRRLALPLFDARNWVHMVSLGPLLKPWQPSTCLIDRFFLMHRLVLSNGSVGSCLRAGHSIELGGGYYAKQLPLGFQEV